MLGKILKSRGASKAVEVARKFSDLLGSNNVSGARNVEAGGKAEVVILTVPYAAQRSTVEEVRHVLEGKILIAGDAGEKHAIARWRQPPRNTTRVQLKMRHDARSHRQDVSSTSAEKWCSLISTAASGTGRRSETVPAAGEQKWKGLLLCSVRTLTKEPAFRGVSL
jgi:hypothetical protein